MRRPVKSTAAHRSGPAALVLACHVLLVASAAAPAAESDEIMPGKNAGPIAIGMTVNDLFRLWGPPERTERDQDGVVLFDYGEARGAGVFVMGDRVSQILAVSPAWTTTSGIRVGATRSEVQAFYGRPDQTLSGQTPNEERYWYKRRGIVFIFRDRTVVAIAVLAGEAEPAAQGLPPDDPARRPTITTPGIPPIGPIGPR